MIGNECRKPSHALASRIFIVGHPYSGCAHHFYLREVPTCLFRSFFHETEAPLDEIRIGELENDAVADAACATQGFRSVSGHPNGRHAAIGPRHLYRMIFVGDLFPAIEITNDLHGIFKSFQCRRLLTHDAARTVAAADTAVHSAAGDTIQRRQQARGDCGIPDDGIRDARTETHMPGIGDHKRE